MKGQRENPDQLALKVHKVKREKKATKEKKETKETKETRAILAETRSPHRPQRRSDEHRLKETAPLRGASGPQFASSSGALWGEIFPEAMDRLFPAGLVPIRTRLRTLCTQAGDL